MKTLLAITTFNQVAMTRECIEYLQKHNVRTPDIIIVDDCSTDGTLDYIKDFRHITKTNRAGLTDSWNRVYKHFKKCYGYEYLIISNNDVLFPVGSIDGLKSKHPLTVPMTNKKGAGLTRKDQDVSNFFRIDVYPEVPELAHRVQSQLDKAFAPIKWWTGFCMCFSRDIIEYERPDGNLFDPANINVGNDDDIAGRVKTYIALGSFVYHYKGISFDSKRIGMTYAEIIHNIESFTNFSWSRFGDGELNCMRGKPGVNCDGHEYFRDLGMALRSVWVNPKGVIAMQSLGYKIHKSWLGEHRWPDADILHHASRHDELELFMDALADRTVIIVGPTHLKKLCLADHFITVGKRNAWRQFDETLKAIKKIVHRNDVILYSCGMMAEVLIHAVYSDSITQIDTGSVFDPYVGVKSREYHYKL